jgi:hypothetical protein
VVSYKEKGLPEGTREILDTTPTVDLKDDIRLYRKQIPRYNHEDWTRNQQINKEIVPELKKWKVDISHVVTTIYKHAENNKLHSRANTELFELLETIKDKSHFIDEEIHCKTRSL